MNATSHRAVRARWGPVLWSVGAILVLSFQVAGAGAGAPHRNVALGPPFHGSISYQDQTIVQPCGGSNATGKIFSPTMFKFRTGTGGVSEGSAASSCSTGQTASGSADGFFRLLLPVHFRIGPPTVFVNGSYALAGALSLTPGSCARASSAVKVAYCDRMAEVQWSLDPTLDNLSARSGYGFGGVSGDNYSYNNTVCRGTHCKNYTSGAAGTTGVFALSGSFAWNMTIGFNLSRTSAYAIEIDFDAETLSECVGSNDLVTGCSAAASLNMATRGNGFLLASIVVT